MEAEDAEPLVTKVELVSEDNSDNFSGISTVLADGERLQLVAENPAVWGLVKKEPLEEMQTDLESHSSQQLDIEESKPFGAKEFIQIVVDSAETVEVEDEIWKDILGSGTVESLNSCILTDGGNKLRMETRTDIPLRFAEEGIEISSAPIVVQSCSGMSDSNKRKREGSFSLENKLASVKMDSDDLGDDKKIQPEQVIDIKIEDDDFTAEDEIEFNAVMCASNSSDDGDDNSQVPKQAPSLDPKPSSSEMDSGKTQTDKIRLSVSSESSTEEETLAVPLTVSELKTTKFLSRPLEEQLRIKALGRPLPHLKISQLPPCAEEASTTSLSLTIYEKCDWICGSELLNAFFCFPCLLLGEKSKWTLAGVKGLEPLPQDIVEHENTKGHLSAVLKLRLLGGASAKSNIVETESLATQRARVLSNRRCLDRLISAIALCCRNHWPFKPLNYMLDSDDEEYDPEPGNLRALLELLGTSDPVFKDELESNKLFHGDLEIIQNKILQSMLKVCWAMIKKEIGDERVAVIVTHASNEFDFGAKAVFFRYVHNFKPVERFWTFLERDAYNVKKYVEHLRVVLADVIVNPDKLISQSYDDSISPRLSIFKDYPSAELVHCYSHDIYSVFYRKFSGNRKLSLCLAILSSFSDFFSAPNRLSILAEYLEKVNIQPVVEDFKLRTAETVYSLREPLWRFFITVHESCRISDIAYSAGNLLNFLEDKDFQYWLRVFSCIMPIVRTLLDDVKNRKTDSPQTTENIFTKFKVSMLKIQEKELVEIDIFALYPFIWDETDRDGLERTGALEVCDEIIKEMYLRFNPASDYLNAPSLDVLKSFAKEMPSRVFAAKFLKTKYKKILQSWSISSVERLLTELEILNESKEFSSITGYAELLNALSKSEVESVFSKLIIFAKELCTVPILTIEPERQLKTFEELKEFLNSNLARTAAWNINWPMAAMAMIAMEYDLTEKTGGAFNDMVMDEFIRENEEWRSEFEFKMT